MAEVELTSVPGQDARRSARVDWSAQVELLAEDALEPTPRVIVAQALDLSPGGMGLSLREHLPVGTHVICRLALDGRDAALGGRVAWLRAHTSPRPHGLGVCFDELSEAQRALLAHEIDRTRAGDRPVELRFGAGQTPMIARARNTPEGLRVSTPLPMLDRGTELAVRFEGEGHAFIGRITGVAISERDGTRRLELDVALNDSANVRFRRQARYGNAFEIASADGRSSEPPAPNSDDELTETGRRAARPRKHAVAADARATASRAGAPATSPQRSTTRDDEPIDPSRIPGRSRVARGVLLGLRVTSTLLLAVACGAAASAWLERSWRSLDPRPVTAARNETDTRPVADDAPTLALHTALPRVDEPSAPSPTLAEAPTAEPPSHAEPAAPTHDENASATPAAGTAVSASMPSTATEPDPQHALSTGAVTLPATATSVSSPNLVDHLAQSAATTTIASAVQPEPTLSVQDNVTVIKIPFSGDLVDMRTTTWASPAAVAIDLPRGRARVLHGYYPLSGGNAAGLRVHQREDELLVRVLLAQAVSRIAVTSSGDSLEIKLTSAP